MNFWLGRRLLWISYCTFLKKELCFRWRRSDKKSLKQVLLKNVTSSKMQTNFYCTHPSCQLRRENERLRAALEPGRGSYSAVIVALLSCLEWLQSCLKHLLFCREPGVGGFNPLRRASAPAVAMVPVPGPTLPGLSAGTVVGSTAVGTPREERLEPGLVRKVTMEKIPWHTYVFCTCCM